MPCARSVPTESRNFNDMDAPLLNAVALINTVADMMDGLEIVAFRLLYNDYVLCRLNDPTPFEDWEEAFIKSYKDNVAIYDGHNIEDFVINARDPEWEYAHLGIPTPMMDTYCVWNDAMRFMKSK